MPSPALSYFKLYRSPVRYSRCSSSDHNLLLTAVNMGVPGCGIADSPDGLVFAASHLLQADLRMGDAFKGVNSFQ